MLLIISLILGLRYTIPDSRIGIEDITGTESWVEKQSELSGMDSTFTGELFAFDPNIVSYSALMKLGLGAKESNTLINYRRKGGKFRLPSDIKKVYGIEEKKAEKLIPYIEISQDTLRKVSRLQIRQSAKYDINVSDSATLVKLPGIGPVLSGRIIRYRRLLGGYATIDQLKEVYGLKVETYDIIKDRVFADSSVIIRININSAGYKELSHIHYFEKYEISAILKYRELKGRIPGISDLTENKLITTEKANKVRPYLKYDE
jgi:DNA uptake protein ComE-like DNA-binding protein